MTAGVLEGSCLFKCFAARSIGLIIPRNGRYAYECAIHVQIGVLWSTDWNVGQQLILQPQMALLKSCLILL